MHGCVVLWFKPVRHMRDSNYIHTSVAELDLVLGIEIVKSDIVWDLVAR